MAIQTFETFPDELVQDPLVLFHGTSNLAEEAIDRDGLVMVTGSEHDEIIMSFWRIYEGILQGMLVTNMKAFTSIPNWTSERQAYGIRPISLALTPFRCALFASAQYAGGEVARTVALVLEELEGFLSDEELHHKWRELSARRNRSMYEGGIPPEFSVPDGRLDLDALSSFLESIKPKCEPYLQLRQQYVYGVIYAVRLDAERDMQHLRWEPSSSGIQVLRPIPVSSVVGKVHVEQTDISLLAMEQDDREREIDLMKMEFWSTLIPPLHS